MEKISLGHGSGGTLSHRLLKDRFLKYFTDEELHKLNDAARLDFPGREMVISTDTFVVDPLFFPGGNIGSLAISGTVNDVAVMGGKPLFLSCGFIIEEGFPVRDLEIILQAMKTTAEMAGIRIITGDTKVVPRGAADKLFINTTGIGVAHPAYHGSASGAIPGDCVLINGGIAEHGSAIMASREGLKLDHDVLSDAAPLNHLVEMLLDAVPEIHVMRDPTRGGVATTLIEIAQQSGVAIQIDEQHIPVISPVRFICEILGIDPLYMANEGKILVFVPEADCEKALNVMQSHPFGTGACMIGRVTDQPEGRVLLKTLIGGKRIVDMLSGDQLPRIC